MRRSVGLVWACVGFLATGAAPVWAENLLANPDFSAGLGAWEVIGSTWFTVVHDPTLGLVAPGSLRILTAETPGDCAVARQCLPVVGGGTYDLGGWFRGTTSQVDVLRGYMAVTWFSEPGCSAAVSNVVTNQTSATAGAWQKVEAENVAAPVTAQSARVELEYVAPNGSAEGHFHDVYFGADPTTPVELQAFSLE